MSYDAKCGDLARYFLGDEYGVTEAEVQELAQDIQRTIEDHLGARNAKTTD